MRRAFKIALAVMALFLLPALPAIGQRVVFEQEVDTSSEVPRVGPNRLLFGHGLMQLGVITGPQEYGMETNWWSGTLTYGGRVKYKLWSWDALVMDFGYRYDNYSISKKQVSRAPFFPGNHQRARVGVNNLTFAFCNRINFGRRGNVLGNWLDLGVYGDWAFRSTFVYVDQYYDSNSPDGYRFKSKTRISRLPYLERVNYGLTAHFGSEMIGIFANYRISDFVTNPTTATNYHDLPRLMIGIEIYTWSD